ncbi:UNVERIFIED_CONTAM: hypothetical protein K2H54_047060 [Gekko kuhli]
MKTKPQCGFQIFSSFGEHANSNFSLVACITCPCCLVSQNKSFALGMALTDFHGFISIKHREKTSLVMIGWPTSVILIDNNGFRHPSIVYNLKKESNHLKHSLLKSTMRQVRLFKRL